jgi:hypothetical protein
VLYIPAGRYRLTRTLTLDHTIYVSVVGEDPQMVTLVWDGAPGGTMLIVNGVAYSRFTRLTYDGRRRASVAVEQSWDNVSPNFDTGNEYSDHAFVDVEYGIHGGFRGHGFAETSILRSRFVRNSKAGVALGNFNALDAWIWHSTFEDCAIGVTNDPGAGNFRVSRCVPPIDGRRSVHAEHRGVFRARQLLDQLEGLLRFRAPINHPATIEIRATRSSIRSMPWRFVSTTRAGTAPRQRRARPAGCPRSDRALAHGDRRRRRQRRQHVHGGQRRHEQRAVHRD